MADGLAIFTQHVRPLLIKRCLKCHGGEAEVQSAFNLATREGLLAGGTSGKAIVPGKAAESRLYRLIRHAEEPYMPQDAPKLSDAEIASIGEWIDRGAPYDESLLPSSRSATNWTGRTVNAKSRQFWAFQPLRLHKPPQLAGKRGETPVDAFIEDALAKKHIGLNPQIDRRKLIRRVSFDLIGLPPTPAEVDAFVNDPSPLAYEALLDRLLASPHYGHRWARHWLDLSRFAESHGFEHD